MPTDQIGHRFAYSVRAYANAAKSSHYKLIILGHFARSISVAKVFQLNIHKLDVHELFCVRYESCSLANLQACSLSLLNVQNIIFYLFDRLWLFGLTNNKVALSLRQNCP